MEYILYLQEKNILELLRKDRLIKPRKKNRGNTKLVKAIDKLIEDIESAKWQDKFEILIKT